MAEQRAAFYFAGPASGLECPVGTALPDWRACFGNHGGNHHGHGAGLPAGLCQCHAVAMVPFIQDMVIAGAYCQPGHSRFCPCTHFNDLVGLWHGLQSGDGCPGDFFSGDIGLFDGLQRTSRDWLQLAQTMGASPAQVLWQIRLPAALPSLASGLRVAATVAPIGAVIGEWVGSSSGLGYLMLHANARMQVDTVFASLIVLACLALLLYFSVDYLLRKLIYWTT